MKTLREFHERAKSNYQELRQGCLAKVVRWIYSAGGPLFSFSSVEVELAGRKRGREIPSPKQAKFKYGFDAEGRLIYEIESPDKWGFAYGYYENLKVVDGKKTYVARYYSTRGFARLENTEQLIYAADGMLQTRLHRPTFLSHGEAEESERYYIWQDNKLVRIEYPKPWDVYQEFLYDTAGTLRQHWQASSRHRTLLYQAPRKGVDLKALQQTIGERLQTAILKTVAGARIKQPVYCLVLAYDGEGNDVLPPCIGMGLDSERQQWIKENGKDAKDLIWNPAEFTHYEKPHTQLKDKQLDKACEMLNDALRPKENFSPAIKLLNSVAAELGKMDWKGRLDTTADFVAYAVDFELGDLKKNLKQSVPAVKLARLKKAGLL